VPADVISQLSTLYIFFICCLNKALAIGERQMLAVQMKSTEGILPLYPLCQNLALGAFSLFL
jgi:hypothetical protein